MRSNSIKIKGLICNSESGHAAPVSYVQIDGKLNRLVSTSQDRVIMVWDIAEQTRLLTLNPKAHGFHGDFMSVSRVGKMLGNAGQWGGGGVDPPAHPPSEVGGSTGGVFLEKK